MSRSEGLYERFSRSVAPSIFGNLDIKKAIACLLFGGSKKILPDGMRLRGDINVLLLGDPGTAKSQLLKFVEKVHRTRQSGCLAAILIGIYAAHCLGCAYLGLHIRQGIFRRGSHGFGSA